METILSINEPNMNFTSWIMPDEKTISFNDSNSFVSTTNTATWLDPLENIISSASSSSMSSPINDQLQINQGLVFGNDIIFTDPVQQSYTTDMMPIIKQEENSINFLSSEKVDKKKIKKRAPRKRLTNHQKQAHNKIEKRYRININTKIAKLQQIIPWVASEETAFKVNDSIKEVKNEMNENYDTFNTEPMLDLPLPPTSVASPQNAKLNKSVILEKAVDYILYLQNNERLYELEVQRLRGEVECLSQDKK